MPATVDLSPDELLTTTRAVRRRLDFDRPVPIELVEECVRIALQAPSGSNARGWHFVVVGDAAKRQRIGELYRASFEQYRGEGRLPFIEGPMGQLAQASQYGSILPAFWSFMLAARARGLGTAWTTLHLLNEREIAELLGIPFDEVMQTALTPVAFTLGTDFSPARGRELGPALHVDSW